MARRSGSSARRRASAASCARTSGASRRLTGPLAEAPGDGAVARLVQTLRDRIVRLLRRRGLWPAPGEEGSEGERDDDSLLPFLSAASIQGRVALGPDAGRRIERLGHAPSDAPSFEPGALCAAIDGFSLHAQVQVPSELWSWPRMLTLA